MTEDANKNDLSEECQNEETEKLDAEATVRDENAELRRQLDQVIATAAANEKIWRHFADIERILFSTRQLDELIKELLKEIKIRFQPDQVILFICDPDLMERFFPDISTESLPFEDGSWILPFPVEAACALVGISSKPSLLSPEEIGVLLNFLPGDASPVKSGVYIPISIHDTLFGGLFLGSLDGGRYRPHDGTDLLEQLSVKVALCMENCLAYERMKNFAARDSLTGLLNFFQIYAELDRELRKASRTGTPLSLLMIDTNYSHESEGPSKIGNEIVKHVAQILTQILPEGESIIGRYGSDEFLVVLPDVQEEEAREVVPYLSRMIRKSPYKVKNTAILIHAVIGVGSFTEDMSHPQDLLDSAYTELCQLKSSRLAAQ